MCKAKTAKALRLKEYIDTIDDFCYIAPEPCPYADHIGALFTDAILQAGLNYRKVVWPRVHHVLRTFPFADTVHAFAEVLGKYGTENVLQWNNSEKIRRIEELVSFCIANGIETSIQLMEFLRYESNISSLKNIKGIGDKTCDYMKRLLGFDTVAVDRHIRTFIEDAHIPCHDYCDIKEIVEFTADLMSCTRRGLDYSIWNYMSRKEKTVIELSLPF